MWRVILFQNPLTCRPPTETQDIDEAALVNSQELQLAIDHVQEIAKTHRAEMIHTAKQQFIRETGSAPAQQMVEHAMETYDEGVARGR